MRLFHEYLQVKTYTYGETIVSLKKDTGNRIEKSGNKYETVDKKRVNSSRNK